MRLEGLSRRFWIRALPVLPVAPRTAYVGIVK